MVHAAPFGDDVHTKQRAALTQERGNQLEPVSTSIRIQLQRRALMVAALLMSWLGTVYTPALEK